MMYNRKPSIFRILTSACLMASTTLFAYEWQGTGPDYTFGTLDEPYTTGTLNIPAEGVTNINSLCLNLTDNSTLNLTGGPLAFTQNAKLSLAGAALINMDVPLTAKDTLQVANAGETSLVIISNVWCTDAVTGKILCTGKNLADYDVVSAFLHGSVAINAEALPYCVFRTNGVYDVQLQTASDGTWIKTLKIRLWQDGDDIRVQALYAHYQKASAYKRGDNMDELVPGLSGATTISDGTTYGYGLETLRLRNRITLDDLGFIAKAPLTMPGTLDVDSNASITFSGNASVTDRIFTNDLNLAGTITFKQFDNTLTITNSLSGENGTITFGPFTDEINLERALGEICTSSGSGESTAQLVASDLKIEDVVGFTNVFLTGNLYTGSVYHVVRDDTSIYAQFQAICPQQSSPYVLCNYIKFYDTNAGLTAKRLYYAFHFIKDGGFLGEDFASEEKPSGQNRSIGTYQMKEISLVFKNGRIRRVNFNPTLNTASGLTINVETNTTVKANTPAAIATQGSSGITMNIANGGELILNAQMANNAPTIFNVEAGGILRQDVCANVFSKSAQVTLNGGTLAFSTKVPSGTNLKDECNTYLNKLVSLGGHLTGLKVRVGTDNTTWTFRGNKPTIWECGCVFVGAGMQYTFTLAVNDATSDDQADLITRTTPLRDFGGNTPPLNDSNQSGTIIKTGTGTWRVEEPCPYLMGTISLKEGCLEIATDNCFTNLGYCTYNKGAPGSILFDGGTLVCAESTSNLLYFPMVLKTDSCLKLKAGATLTFPDCSTKEWTAGTQLEIIGDLPAKTLRFGTNASGLTAAQKHAIRLNGLGIVLDANGYVCPRGTTLFIR